MPRGKHITKEQYDLLVASYIEQGPVHTRAAAVAMVDEKTARKFWEHGDTKKGWAAISAVHAQHVEKAKADYEAGQRRLAAEEQQRRDDAKKIAIATRTEEQQLTQFARKELLPLLATIANLNAQASSLAMQDKNNPGLQPIAHALFEHEIAKARIWITYEQALMAGVPNVTKPAVEKPKLQLEVMVRYMQRLGVLTQRSVAAVHECMQVTRLHLGEPTDIIGIVDETREMTVEELRLKTESALAALQSEEDRAKAGGEPPELRVVTGGKK